MTGFYFEGHKQKGCLLVVGERGEERSALTSNPSSADKRLHTLRNTWAFGKGRARVRTTEIKQRPAN